MATRTFLTSDELALAHKILLAPLTRPEGRVQQEPPLQNALDFSSWLSLTIEKRFRQFSSWEAAHPIAIGSWGRGELCPGSDLDVIFCGDTKAVEDIVTRMAESGIKLRYRMPEDLKDWSKGVEVLEVNALFSAKPFTQKAAEELQWQKDLILRQRGRFRQKLLKAIQNEKKLRIRRYDSIANFLEPNLKFGAGGLRDLHQALILKDWFPERFTDYGYVLNVFQYYKCFFLLLRQKLHLEHSHDILSASDQLDLTRWLGFEKNRDFMMEVQKGLSSVSFYADWVLERSALTQKQLNHYQNKKVQSLKEALALLKKDSSLHAQALIRQHHYQSHGFKGDKMSGVERGEWLKKYLDIKQDDSQTVAFFRSHLISALVPQFEPLIGLVQHDQYHRFSVDAHLMQAVREVQNIINKPSLLGALADLVSDMNKEDASLLRLAALYHDLGKGHHGPHEKVGAEFVREDFKRFGFPKEWTEEVAWLVENHLILSTAAFRKNPSSPQTWSELFKRGVRGARLLRLAIFTAIDIRATNPDAWNTWKENLLRELVRRLQDPQQERHYDFSEKLRKKGIELKGRWIENLDPALLVEIPSHRLIKDLQDILAGKQLKPLVLKGQNNRLWIRFHRFQDEKGLLYQFTQSLSHMGCNIRQALIHTDDQLGVYDWFAVKTKKTIPILKKQLLHNISESKLDDCQFSRIDLISADENEWVLSFRAKDKKGLLLSAIRALYENDLEIRWAKVHTWGRQIDDIFGVLPKKTESPEQILTSLKQTWESPELEIL